MDFIYIEKWKKFKGKEWPVLKEKSKDILIRNIYFSFFNALFMIFLAFVFFSAPLINILWKSEGGTNV